MFTSRKQLIFFILTGFFITNAIVAELIGGKLMEMPAINLGLFTFPSVVLSVGVILWPVVFISTDLVNEYFGKPAVRRLTLLTVAMIAMTFVVLYVASSVPTWENSPVKSEQFDAVFRQSQWIIVGSIIAFAVSQLVDVAVFWFFRERTGGRQLWLRATGSTVVSQLIDTFVINFIAFVVPGKMTFDTYLAVAGSAYVYKLIIAIVATPVIYFAHHTIDRYLAEGKAAAPGDQ